MTPTPKKLAALISLLGLGLPFPATALGEEPTGNAPDQLAAAEVPSTDAAIRRTLALADAPPAQAAKTAATYEHAFVPIWQISAASPKPQPSEPDWTTRTLGLESTAIDKIRSAVRGPSAIRQKPAVHENQAAKPEEELPDAIRSARGLVAIPLQLGRTAPRMAAPPAEVQALPADLGVDAARTNAAPLGDAQDPAPEAPAGPDMPFESSTPAAVPVREPVEPPLAVQHATLMPDPSPAPNEPTPDQNDHISIPVLAFDRDSKLTQKARAPATYSLVTALPEQDPVIVRALPPVLVLAPAQRQPAAGDIASTVEAAGTVALQRESTEAAYAISTLAGVEDAEPAGSSPVVSADSDEAINAELAASAESIGTEPARMALLAASYNLELARQILLPLLRLDAPAQVVRASLEPAIILTPAPSNIALQLADPPQIAVEEIVDEEIVAAPVDYADLPPGATPARVESMAQLAEALQPAARQHEPTGRGYEWRPTIIERAMALAAQRNAAAPQRQALLPPLLQATEATLGGETPTFVSYYGALLADGEPIGQEPKAAVAQTSSAETPVQVAEPGKSATASSGEVTQPAANTQHAGLEGDNALPTMEQPAMEEEEDRVYPASSGPESEPGANPLQGNLLALGESTLDEVRGGFLTDGGLQISFGIERAVYVNGNLIATTSLNLSDLNKMSAGQAELAGLSPGSLGLIQIGPGNTFQPGALSPSSVASVIQNTLNGQASVIQNTLNDQKIQNVTTISATVNSLEVLKGLNLQSSLRNAITDSLNGNPRLPARRCHVPCEGAVIP